MVDLKPTLDLLPALPGVYLMKDAAGEVLYVGKARSLRQRVRSYFQPSQQHPPRIAALLRKVASIEHIVTDSEVEALILECNLIKKYRPRYNVRLRDDKRYPYLKLTAEPFPRLIEVRQVEPDGARYFGPYTDTTAMRHLEQVLRQVFRLRTCTYHLPSKERMRPCLDYHLGLCDAPCAGLISAAKYQKLVAGAAQFLSGRQEPLLCHLRAEMEAAAESLDFERAAKFRDHLRAVEKIVARQKIVSPRSFDADVIGLAQREGLTCAKVFFVREGKLVGQHHVLLDGTAEEEPTAVLSAFLQQYYAGAPQVPPQVFLPRRPENAETLAAWLTFRRGRTVRLHVPQRGDKRRLVELAEKNAHLTLEQYQAEQRQQRQRAEEAVMELRERLGLPRPPFRIEAFDIATLQGDESVGSLVVFKNGRPSKKDYRRFQVRLATEHPDDYAMLREVLSRRLQRALEGDPKFSELPDLLVVDGGKGQLNVARQVLAEKNLEHIPVAALAKRFEHLYLPDRPRPLVLEERSPARQLLQALRDEAHRFANEYHRKRRRRASVRSILDDIPGIGPKRRTQLLAHFASTEAIKNASVEEIAAVPGMNRAVAERVHRYLNSEAWD